MFSTLTNIQQKQSELMGCISHQMGSANTFKITSLLPGKIFSN